MADGQQENTPIYEEIVSSKENLEVDPEHPGDEVTTHEEDDDPQQHAGEFVEEENDN